MVTSLAHFTLIDIEENILTHNCGFMFAFRYARNFNVIYFILFYLTQMLSLEREKKFLLFNIQLIKGSGGGESRFESICTHLVSYDITFIIYGCFLIASSQDFLIVYSIYVIYFNFSFFFYIILSLLLRSEESSSVEWLSHKFFHIIVE
jgi:hypothetical protein